MDYYNSVAFSALPTALVAVSSGFFTGLGRTQTVIWINFVGLVLNIILDYMLSVLPSMGVAQAVLILVGQSLGHKDPERARVMTWAGVQVTLMYMSWFKNEQNAALWEQVSVIVPVLLKIVAVFTIFDSLYFNISFALKGAGDTKFVSLIALILPWPLMVLPAYLVKDWNNAVVWAWAFAIIYSIVITSTLALRFRQGRWKTMSVIHPS